MPHRAFLAAALCALASTAAADPVYNDAGEMLLPENYDTWVFVGSNIGLAYADEAKLSTSATSVFHNVYMENAAYAAFMETKEFQDKTQFLFEVYASDSKDPGDVLTQGFFNGDLLAIEAAVKDSERPIFDDSKEVWAYYDFGASNPTARAQPDATCFACHAAHADFDHVWVQFYPRLRARLSE